MARVSSDHFESLQQDVFASLILEYTLGMPSARARARKRQGQGPCYHIGKENHPGKTFRLCSVVVITPDSESGDPSSTLGMASNFFLSASYVGSLHGDNRAYYGHVCLLKAEAIFWLQRATYMLHSCKSVSAVSRTSRLDNCSDLQMPVLMGGPRALRCISRKR